MVFRQDIRDTSSSLCKLIIALKYKEDKMNWEKLNMREIKFYCHSNLIDFDCWPFGEQIKQIVCMFYYYDITSFNIDDIKEFYNKMQIPAPRTEGIRKPSPSQIQKALDRLKNIKNRGENGYEILNADTEIYEKQIKQGYEKNRIL